MSEPRPSLSQKVENLVFGIVKFANRYVRTSAYAVVKPWSFGIGLARARRRRRIVPPLTFLIVGCFFFSVIIDTYPEGWIVYFNWIWLEEEVSKKIRERSGDLFSLTAVVRSGLPTFLCFAVLAQAFAWLLAGSRWLRPRVFTTLIYAFGLHAAVFAFACFLPIIGIYALNPETSDSFVSNIWQYGVAYLVLGLTVIFGIVAFVSPVLLLMWSAQRREARSLFKPLAVRSIASVPLFIFSIVLATELGSLPARFTSALTPLAKVEFQSMGEFILHGKAAGDLSGATSVILFHNKTNDLAYIDTSYPITSVTITLPNGSEIPTKDNPKTTISDENKAPKSILPILPGKTQLVYFQVSWEIDGTLGSPTTSYDDGSWWYEGVTVGLNYDPIRGADLKGNMRVELGNPTVNSWP